MVQCVCHVPLVAIPLRLVALVVSLVLQEKFPINQVVVSFLLYVYLVNRIIPIQLLVYHSVL